MMVTVSKVLLVFEGFLLSSKLPLPVVKSVAFAASLFPEQQLQPAEKQSEVRPPACVLLAPLTTLSLPCTILLNLQMEK